MTTLLDRPGELASNLNSAGVDRRGFRLPTLSHRRRPLLVAISAVAVFASVGLFARLYSSADRRSPVLVATGTIQQGQVLTAGELGEAQVAAGPGVASIPADDATDVLGKVAATTIASGSLLTPGEVSSAAPIAAGDAVVGVALKPGQLPAGGVRPSDHVMVVETGQSGSPITSVVGPSDGTSGGTAGGSATSSPTATPGGAASQSLQGPSGVLAPDATVFDTQAPAAQSGGDVTELVSLEVTAGIAPAVSAAATAGQVSLVLLPPSSVGGPSRGASGTGTGSGPDSGQRPARTPAAASMTGRPPARRAGVAPERGS